MPKSQFPNIPQKKESGIRKTQNRKEVSDSRNSHSSKEILILTEGETEAVYLNFFLRKLNLFRYVRIRQSKKPHPEYIVETAFRFLNGKNPKHKKYKEVWAVFDRDYHPRFSETLKTAEKQGIQVCWSSPCIEAWFLLHFSDLSFLKKKKLVRIEENVTVYAPADCLEALKKIWPVYHKTSQNLGSPLATKLPDALERLWRVRKEGEKVGSTFPELIFRLAKLAREKECAPKEGERLFDLLKDFLDRKN